MLEPSRTVGGGSSNWSGCNREQQLTTFRVGLVAGCKTILVCSANIQDYDPASKYSSRARIARYI